MFWGLGSGWQHSWDAPIGDAGALGRKTGAVSVCVFVCVWRRGHLACIALAFLIYECRGRELCVGAAGAL